MIGIRVSIGGAPLVKPSSWNKRIAKVATIPSRDAKRHVLETWNRGQSLGERAAVARTYIYRAS